MRTLGVDFDADFGVDFDADFGVNFDVDFIEISAKILKIQWILPKI